MNKLSIKHQIIILSVILVAMFALFYFFVWSPQLAKLDGLAQEEKDYEGKIKAAKARIAMLSEVKKNAANAEVELIKIQNKMPTDAELPSLIVEFQNMANDAGVTLVSIKPTEPKPMGEYNEIGISASAVGSYVSLIDLLRRVEKSTRAMKVGTIDVKVGEYPDLVLNLSISAFTMGTPVAAPAAAPAAPGTVQPGAPAAPAAPTAQTGTGNSGQNVANR